MAAGNSSRSELRVTLGGRMPYMKVLITLLTGAGLMLLEAGGALKGSVGGSLTTGFFLIAAALVAGIYDAWSMKRGVLGWVGSIVASILGAFAGNGVAGLAMVSAIAALHLEGRPGPLLLAMLGMVTLLGSWIALSIADRFR